MGLRKPMKSKKELQEHAVADLKTMFAASWGRFGVFDRLNLVFTTLSSVVLIKILRPVAAAIGLVTKRDQITNSTLHRLAPDVYQLQYWINHDSNTTILRGCDGKLFIHSPPPCQEATVNELLKLGDIGAICIPSRGHDTFAADWAERFPEAVVVGVEADVPSSNAVIDTTLDEDTKLLKNYRIVQVLEAPAQLPERSLVIDIGGNDRAVLTFCGFGNGRTTLYPFSLLMALNGFHGLRCFRQYALLFAKDVASLQAHRDELASVAGLKMVLFQHGKALTDPAQLKDLLISKSPFAYANSF